ncbi:SLC24A4 [Branchiostoma lanceolatum]|nr:SLC24A4 [Branchiostoma lanceolatum]CAH1262130.1 SLC24A4 [Branchiostoma lanceolatum]
MYLRTASHRSTARRKTRWQVAAAIFLVLWGTLAVIVSLQKLFDEEDVTRTAYAETDAPNSPRGNCSPPAINRFPTDVFTQEQRRHGAVILHVIATLYMFLALAIICDDYFVPSLEKISEGLHLQPDVAGATFMAAGSSAPELFTSIFGVFISRDDIGVGTIVGSAVFNLLFIVGLCGLVVKTAITLTLWPLLRDCSFYLISVAALAISLYDGKVHWYEAVILVALYCLYVVLMYFNPQLSEGFTRCFPSPAGSENKEHNEETVLITSVAEKGTEGKTLETPSDDAVTTQSKETVSDEPESPFSVPSGLWRRVLWVVGLPLTLLLAGTVPDCRRDRWKRWYPVSFIMSVAWIGVFTYILVWMVTVIGFTVGVPDTVMGLTLIAIGTSVPDAMSSVLVSKEGEGDMAVSNAVGSNVFDILVGLGVPWFVRTAVVQTNSVVSIQSGGLVYSAVTLLSTVLVLLFTMWLNRWRLDRKLGVICGCLYALFITLATLYELNVFGDFNPPTCPGSYTLMIELRK